jgi:hypothetical protein
MYQHTNTHCIIFQKTACFYQHHFDNNKFYIIYNVFGAIRTFEIKLKVLREQMKNVNLCHFSSCDSLHKSASLNIPFPNIHAAEIVEILDENFKTRFNNFRTHVVNIICKNQLPV